jgi:hypothetical protein
MERMKGRSMETAILGAVLLPFPKCLMAGACASPPTFREPLR